MSNYGFCPKCGGITINRERRMNGNDTCENGCVYPSAETLHKRPESGFKTTDPKYNIAFGQGGKPVLVNATTGKEIEEPIFILRAKDKHAAAAIWSYLSRCENPEHQCAVFKRYEEFLEWQDTKEPDTQ